MINLVSFNKNNKKKEKKNKKGTVNIDIKINQISTYERLIGWLVGCFKSIIAFFSCCVENDDDEEE